MNEDNNNLISVVDLADRLKVSKQSVFYNANKINVNLVKLDGASYLTYEHAERIKQRINSNKRNKSKSSNNNQTNVNHAETQSDSVKQAVNDDLINVLKEQLKVKDEQIKQLNNTLDEQQRLLHNQQSLALQSSAKIEQLETELREARLLLNSKSDVSDVKQFNSDPVIDKVKSDVPNIKKDDSMIKNLLTIFRFVLKK